MSDAGNILARALGGALQGAAHGAGQALLMEMEEKKQQRMLQYGVNLKRAERAIDSAEIGSKAQEYASQRVAKTQAEMAPAEAALDSGNYTDEQRADLKGRLGSAYSEGLLSGPTLREKAMAQADVTNDYGGILKVEREDARMEHEGKKIAIAEKGAELKDRIQAWREADSEEKRKIEARRVEALFAKASRSEAADKLPSDAKMAEWMVQKGVAKDEKDAYHQIKQSKTHDDLALRVQIFSSLGKNATGQNEKSAAWELAGKMVGDARGGTVSAPSTGSKLDSLFPPKSK